MLIHEDLLNNIFHQMSKCKKTNDGFYDIDIEKIISYIDKKQRDKIYEYMNELDLPPFSKVLFSNLITNMGEN